MKKNRENVIGKVYSYFLPAAWKKHKGYFVIQVLNLIISVLQPFINILLMPLIVDELVGGRDVQKITQYVLGIILLNYVHNMLSGVFNNFSERYSLKFENYFKALMSGRTMELDFQLMEDKKALDQLELARNGMTWYSGGLTGLVKPLFDMINGVLTLAGVTAIVVTKAPLLLIITLLMLTVTTIINAKLNEIEQKQYAELSKVNRIFSYMGFNLTDFRYGKDIRLYDAKDMMVEKWEYHSAVMGKHWETIADKQLPLIWLTNVADIIRDFGTYFVVGVLAITGKISLGITTQMFSAAGTFYSSMRAIVVGYQELAKKSNYAYEYVKFMDYPAAIYKGNKQVEEKPHTIEFKNVSFTYPGSEVAVLKGVNLTLTQGEHLSVVGLNGAGKTTFIKLLCRLYDPTGGEILLDGVDIREYEYDEYMKLFAPVFQDFKLFGFTMKENLLMKDDCSEKERKEIEQIFEKVGLTDKLSTLSEGMDTYLFKYFDKTGIDPSGGEQQKLAIARALYKDAPVVILDEPTAALDPIAEYEIYKQFEELVHGKTAIYISHRLSSCQFCDHIAVFSEGVVKEYGTHAELYQKENGIYAEMFAAQAQYYVS